MKVTDVEPQRKRGRFNVYVDKEFWFGISEITLSHFNLYPDKDINQSLLDEIIEYEIFTKIYDRAIGKISRRPHSEKEIRDYISNVFWKKRRLWFKGTKYEKKSKDLEQKITNQVIDKLISNKILSDQDFARWFVESRVRSRPRSWLLIKQELLAKGISNDIMNEMRTSLDEEKDMAQRVFEKAFRSKSPTKDKVISRLQGKGFSWDVIKEILKNNSIE